MTSSSVRRRLGASVLAATLAVAVLTLSGARSATATEDVKSTRIAGSDRFATAAAVAKEAFPNGASTVAVASGRSFPDALAGAALGVPVLLTERDSLPSVTAAAIDSLKAKNAIMLGGTGAVSAKVASEIGKHATVSRLAGNDRYETAAAIASSVGASSVGNVDGKKTAIVATGRDFADALAGGPLATGATGSTVLPILLVNTDVPSSTSKAITDLGIKQVLLLGGTGAISDDVAAKLEQQTGNKPVRLAGTNRFGTAVAIAEFAISKLAFPADLVLLANGFQFADALAGGPLGGVKPAPLLLTDPLQLSSETKSFLIAHANKITAIDTLGGTAAVSTSTQEAAEKAAETPAKSNATITVTPSAAASQANGSTRQFTVSGLSSTPVDIALMPCGFVTQASNGDYLFTNTNKNTTADSGAASGGAPDEANTTAYISSVNGSTEVQDTDHNLNNDDYYEGATPAAGKVTFVVTGQSGASTPSSCVVPVVFIDANSSTSLTVDATTPSNPAKPIEQFGLGGKTTFGPAANGGGGINVNVNNNDDEANTFDGCTIANANPEQTDPRSCSTFTYDSNDSFQIGGVTKTLSEFETALSPGDDVKGTYNATPSATSTFNLAADEAPEAPTISPDPRNPAVTSTTVSIDFFESSRSTVDSYRLYRATKPTTSGASCPSFAGTSFTGVSLVDENHGNQDITSPLTITDTGLTPNTSYCYYIVSVDQGDEGPPSALVEAKTTQDTSAGRPKITSATGSSADNTLNVGDVHQLVFDTALVPATATSATYTVTSGSGQLAPTATITCGDNATCTLSADGKTLRVTLTTALSGSSALNPPTYPLTISAASNMKDSSGNDVTLTGSDTTIEANTLSGDNAGPFITGASFASGAANGFGDTGDVLKVTFNEPVVAHVANPSSVTETELKAILGAALTYKASPPTNVSMTVSGSDVTFTVNSNLQSGVGGGTKIDGTTNSYIRDAADNLQQPNPTADPTMPSS